MTHISSLAFVQLQSEQMKHVLVACNIEKRHLLNLSDSIPIHQLILITVKKKNIYIYIVLCYLVFELQSIILYLITSVNLYL